MPEGRGSNSGPAKEGRTEDAEQKRQLLGFFAHKFRKSSNAPAADSRNHTNPGAVSHQLAAYKDAAHAVAKPLGNYNSVSQPVKAQHGSILRSFSGTKGLRSSSKAKQ